MITAMAGVRVGHLVPLKRGKLSGIKLVIRMPANRQVTNSGSLSPSWSSPSFNSNPKITLIWMARIACATFGLILASLMGGPIAKFLINRHNLTPDEVETQDVGLSEEDLERLGLA